MRMKVPPLIEIDYVSSNRVARIRVMAVRQLIGLDPARESCKVTIRSRASREIPRNRVPRTRISRGGPKPRATRGTTLRPPRAGVPGGHHGGGGRELHEVTAGEHQLGPELHLRGR